MNEGLKKNPKQLSEFSRGRYKTEGPAGKEQEAILEEDDELWVKIRHKHIADVIEYVNKTPKIVKYASYESFSERERV